MVDVVFAVLQFGFSGNVGPGSALKILNFLHGVVEVGGEGILLVVVGLVFGLIMVSQRV